MDSLAIVSGGVLPRPWGVAGVAIALLAGGCGGSAGSAPAESPAALTAAPVNQPSIPNDSLSTASAAEAVRSAVVSTTHMEVYDTVSPGLDEIPLTDPTGPTTETWSLRTFNELVHAADFTVVGTVTGLTEHRDDDGSTLSHLAVDLALDEPAAGTSFGDGVTYAQAMPPRSDVSVDGLPAELPKDRRFGPNLTVGDRVLTLLEWRTIATADGPWPVLMPVGGYQSTWVLDQGVARSDDPLRSVPEADLLDRLEGERYAGPTGPHSQPELAAHSQTTRRNPLGDGTVAAPRVLDGPSESGPLPALNLGHSLLVNVSASPPHSDVVASFGPDTAGGFTLQIEAGGQVVGAASAISIDGLSGRGAAAFLPDGLRVALAALGDRGTAPERVAVTASSGEPVEVAVVVSPIDGRVVMIVVVPVGVTGVSVVGLSSDGTTSFSLPVNQCAVIAGCTSPPIDTQP